MDLTTRSLNQSGQYLEEMCVYWIPLFNMSAYDYDRCLAKYFIKAGFRSIKVNSKQKINYRSEAGINVIS